MRILPLHFAMIAALICAAHPSLAQGPEQLPAPEETQPAVAEDQWQPIISEDGLFSVEMPAMPTFNSRVKGYAVGDIEENTYELIHKDSEFVVEYIDLPGIVMIFGRGIIYRMAKRSFLRENRVQEIGFKDFDLGPLGGKELLFEHEGHGASPGRPGTARFVLAGKRLYVIVASADKVSKAASWVDRFLDSFEIFAGSSRHRAHKYWEMRQESLSGGGQPPEGESTTPRSSTKSPENVLEDPSPVEPSRAVTPD